MTIFLFSGFLAVPLRAFRSWTRQDDYVSKSLEVPPERFPPMYRSTKKKMVRRVGISAVVALGAIATGAGVASASTTTVKGSSSAESHAIGVRARPLRPALRAPWAGRRGECSHEHLDHGHQSERHVEHVRHQPVDHLHQRKGRPLRSQTWPLAITCESSPDAGVDNSAEHRHRTAEPRRRGQRGEW